MSVVRFSVSLPKSLAKKLDEVYPKLGFKSRSSLVEHALRDYLAEALAGEGKVVGVLVVLYDHEKSKELIHIQHQFLETILASTHLHVTEKLCLEAIMVRGDAQEIRKLMRFLRRQKGVKQLKSIFVSVPEANNGGPGGIRTLDPPHAKRVLSH